MKGRYLIFLALLVVLFPSCQKEDPKPIERKYPVITWAKPADIVIGTTLSALQLNATADIPGTFKYSPALGTQLNKGNNQELTVRFFPDDSTSYHLMSASVKINVIAKSPVITWADPHDAIVGLTLSSLQLNATADVSGTFVYTPPVGTVLSKIETKYLKVDFTPDDLENYSVATKTVRLTLRDTMFFNSNLTYGSVTDYDGNIYKTITIGTQTWMAEDLRVTHYRNGEPIPFVEDYVQWMTSKTGGYCYYQHKPEKKKMYGLLYNWYAAADQRMIAPEGWHVPSDLEYEKLAEYLGGKAAAGGKMKEATTIHWKTPNTDATNESGFTGIPGGFRLGYSNILNSGDVFADLGTQSNYWCSNDLPLDRSYGNAYLLEYSYSIFGRISYHKNYGCSIRCIKD